MVGRHHDRESEQDQAQQERCHDETLHRSNGVLVPRQLIGAHDRDLAEVRRQRHVQRGAQPLDRRRRSERGGDARHRHVDPEEIDTTLRQPLDDHGDHRDEIELDLSTSDRDVRQFFVVLVQEGLHLPVDLTIEIDPQLGERGRCQETLYPLLDQALRAGREGTDEEARLRWEVRDG